MKSIVKIAACFAGVWFLSVASCRKDPPNHSPIARAGFDLIVVLPTCGDNSTGSAELDGTSSSDPDNNIVSYRWVYVSGPGAYYLRNSSSAKAIAQNLIPGEYVFELRIVDAGGLQSKDRILIRVKGTPKEYDLDITFNGSFSFIEDIALCYYYYNCSYSDLTQIQGNGQFLPVGEFNINVSEYADVDDFIDTHNTVINIYQGNINSAMVVGGDCSVYFKKIIKTGGGLFNGTLRLSGGSALNCDANVFTNLPLLTVTGNLDTVTKTVTMRIQGKVYF